MIVFCEYIVFYLFMKICEKNLRQLLTDSRITFQSLSEWKNINKSKQKKQL